GSVTTGSTLTLTQKNVLTSRTTIAGASLNSGGTITFKHIGLTGTPSLTFTHNAGGADTIDRDTGDWSSDGFQPGQTIAVSGTGLVNNDGVFQIASITNGGKRLTLAAGNFVASETVSGVSVSAPNTPDTITRASGSWSTDGFQAGQSITVAGTTSNNGVFQIGSISPDGKTLTPVDGEPVSNETPARGTQPTSTVRTS